MQWPRDCRASGPGQVRAAAPAPWGVMGTPLYMLPGSCVPPGSLGFCSLTAPLSTLQLGPAPQSASTLSQAGGCPCAQQTACWSQVLVPTHTVRAAEAPRGAGGSAQSPASLCLCYDSGSFLLEGVLGKLTPRLWSPSAPPLTGGPPSRPGLTPASRCSLCIFCGERSAAFTEEGLDLHYWKHCLMLTRCGCCRQVGRGRQGCALRLGLSGTWVVGRVTE